MVKRHVQSCRFCQEHNKQSVKYSKYNFEAEPAPMKFISMDLIGEFHPPSSKGNRYALTVIACSPDILSVYPYQTKEQRQC